MGVFGETFKVQIIAAPYSSSFTLSEFLQWRKGWKSAWQWGFVFEKEHWNYGMVNMLDVGNTGKDENVVSTLEMPTKSMENKMRKAQLCVCIHRYMCTHIYTYILYTWIYSHMCIHKYAYICILQYIHIYDKYFNENIPGAMGSWKRK
jgi:hypothetical protein